MYRVSVLLCCFSFSAGLLLNSLNPVGKLVVCTQVKDEIPYLFEWIAFHRSLGVDQFDIYNHHGSDGVERLPEMYSAAGKPYVSVFKAQAQDWSFSNCLARHQDAAWVGIFDVDEFVSLQHESPRCQGPRLKCFLSQYMQSGYAEVYIPALRFSSNRQVWRLPNPIKEKGVSLAQRLTKHVGGNLPLNCTNLLLEKSSRKPEDPCSGGPALATITGSHIFRGPSPYVKDDKYDSETIQEQYPNCFNKTLTMEEFGSGWSVCHHGMGKSFVRPQFCTNYIVHGCQPKEEKERGLKKFTVDHNYARINHYFTRSAEDACKHAAGWSDDRPLGAYKYADDGFFHAIKDPLLDSADQARLQNDMFSVLCQAHKNV